MEMESPSRSRPAGIFLVALGAALLLGVAGYYFGFLGFVYEVMMPNAFGRFDLYTLAVITGIAAFFSPCAFPLLPGYVAYHLTAGREPRGSFGRASYMGGLAALGLTSVNLAVGLVVAAFGAAVFQPDPRLDHPAILAARVTAGLTVMILGAATVAHHSFNLGSFLSSKLGRSQPGKNENPAKGAFAYGLLYNGVGIGCTGPIMLSLVLYALTIGSFWTALTGFFVFAATMAVLMFGVTLIVGLSRGALLSRLKASTRAINKIGGVVMMAAGMFIVVLTGNELFTRIFFPFLQARPFTTGQIAWVVVTFAVLLAFTGYVLSRSRRVDSGAERRVIPSRQGLSSIRLRIEGIHCGSCASTIERALANQNGILGAKVDSSSNFAEIVFDPSKTNAPRILDAVIFKEPSAFRARIS